jgi:hypothetical protein
MLQQQARVHESGAPDDPGHGPATARDDDRDQRRRHGQLKKADPSRP